MATRDVLRDRVRVSFAEHAAVSERPAAFWAAGAVVGVGVVALLYSASAVVSAASWLVVAALCAFLLGLATWLGVTHATVPLTNANAYVEYPRSEFDWMRLIQSGVFGAQLGFGLFYSTTLVYMALGTALSFVLWFEGYVRPTMRKSAV